ncbi:putative ribosomal protein S24/S35 [Helianthus anomalus]
MRRALFNKLPVRHLLNPNRSSTSPPNPKIINSPFCSFGSNLRFFSTENENSSTDQSNIPSESNSILQPPSKELDVKDVSNKELKMQIEKYFKEKDEEALPDVVESIFRRKITQKHADTDDELLDEFNMQPIDGVNDQEFESDFDELHETDDEIDNLYNAKDIVINRMTKDEFFYMDDKKWEGMIKEAVDSGHLKDTKECEQILQDMFMWEKLLPDHLKKLVEEKYNEIADMVETGELEPEQGYEMYQEFEHNMLMKHTKEIEEAGPPKFDEAASALEKKDIDDPPGEGPVLRWQTRVVFVPGGDSWHPKNRKAKLAVTVKELGLSKNQFRRLRELVGKRYNSGKDELTITSERFEHREENRKDCLRTLFGLIEEAGKADKLVEDARTSYVKTRLRANQKFMEKLNAKIMKNKGSSLLHA